MREIIDFEARCQQCLHEVRNVFTIKCPEVIRERKSACMPPQTRVLVDKVSVDHRRFCRPTNGAYWID